VLQLVLQQTVRCSDSQSASLPCRSSKMLTSEPKPYEINELRLYLDSEARKHRNKRSALSVADEHTSDKQSHDLGVNCNTQLLQLRFKIDYYCTTRRSVRESKCRWR